MWGPSLTMAVKKILAKRRRVFAFMDLESDASDRLMGGNAASVEQI